jgi:hypothetical protein
VSRLDPSQLIRIARLQRFVGVFARGEDREATAAALAELAAASQANGLTAEALMRSRQAAELATDDDDDDDPETRARALLQLGSACLDSGDAAAAIAASELAIALGDELESPGWQQLHGCASLIGGVAHAALDDHARARALLDDARDRLVAAGQPAGAALALAQQALLDLEVGRKDGAQVCFQFARDFYRLAARPVAIAELSALAARSLAEHAAEDVADPMVEAWYVEAIAASDAAGMARLAAELVVERALRRERLPAATATAPPETPTAAELAAEGLRRFAALDERAAARSIEGRARLVLARAAADPNDALRHLDAAFELGLDDHDPAALGRVMDVVVSELVDAELTPTDRSAGWRLVDRFRERLAQAGFDSLADAAALALLDLRA